MKPGRGPMMKTGQGIPQTFQSPEKQAGALLQEKQDPKEGTIFTANDDTGATLSSSNSTTTPSKTREKTNFSADPSEKAKQKEWIKKNPEKYKKALEDKNKRPVTKTSTVTESDGTSKNKIKKESKSQLQEAVGQLNMERFKNEMLAVQDSSKVASKTYIDLLKANPTLTSKQGQQNILRHSANAGNAAANETRKKKNLPKVERISGTHDRFDGSINKGNSVVPVNKYWTINGKVDNSKTEMLPNERSTFKRKSKLYFDIPK